MVNWAGISGWVLAIETLKSRCNNKLPFLHDTKRSGILLLREQLQHIKRLGNFTVTTYNYINALAPCVYHVSLRTFH